MADTNNQAAIEQLPGFSPTDKPEYSDYSRCVHCGLCLDHCPTYRLWGREADSPRGRIRQMVLVDEHRLPLAEKFVTHMDRCLDCRACETACPSGVEYGKLIELARAQIQQNYRRPLLSRALRDLAYRRLLPYPNRIATLAKFLRFFQASGLEILVRKTHAAGLFGMQERLELAPRIDREFFTSRMGQTFAAQGPRRARVALFAGCIARVTFTALNDATIRVLQANGCEVVVPAAQTCCGALAAHAGMRDEARALAKANLAAFASEDFDAIIVNAAGCGSTLKEYPDFFENSGQIHAAEGGNSSAARAAAFSSRIKDISEFLDQLGWIAPLAPPCTAPVVITMQDSCHLIHGQKIREAPRRLLAKIPWLELREMRLADQCCGSAGVYNVTQPAAAAALLEEKMRYASETQAPIIVTSNPGCILQLRAGATRYRTKQEVLHVVELLDRANQAAQVNEAARP
jgi:glycolate oxidase iron-sulfur subunit